MKFHTLEELLKHGFKVTHNDRICSYEITHKHPFSIHTKENRILEAQHHGDSTYRISTTLINVHEKTAPLNFIIEIASCPLIRSIISNPVEYSLDHKRKIFVESKHIKYKLTHFDQLNDGTRFTFQENSRSFFEKIGENGYKRSGDQFIKDLPYTLTDGMKKVYEMEEFDINLTDGQVADLVSMVNSSAIRTVQDFDNEFLQLLEDVPGAELYTPEEVQTLLQRAREIYFKRK